MKAHTLTCTLPVQPVPCASNSYTPQLSLSSPVLPSTLSQSRFQLTTPIHLTPRRTHTDTHYIHNQGQTNAYQQKEKNKLPYLKGNRCRINMTHVFPCNQWRLPPFTRQRSALRAAQRNVSGEMLIYSRSGKKLAGASRCLLCFHSP